MSRLDTYPPGYKFHLIFLWLNSPDLAILRVKERVKMGGHSVPEDTIRRRYNSGLGNFFKLYRSLADSWQLYDNSESLLSLIASAKKEAVTIQNTNKWKYLQETYCGIVNLI